MSRSDPPLIRTSERKLFRKCPQAWWWTYREGLVTKGRPADELWFGTGVHYALAEWYGEGFTRGAHPADTWEAWVGDETRDIKAGKEDWDEADSYADAKAMGVNMLEGYVLKYGEDPDLEILAIEQPFQIELTKGGKLIAVFAGTVDGVGLDHTDGKTYLLEHKTAKTISTTFLALDDQAGGYFAVGTTLLRSLGMLGPRDALDGVLYNYLRKAAPDGRERDPETGAYLNLNGTVSKKQPAPMLHREFITRSPAEVQQQLMRLTDEARIMNGIRAGTVPLVKNTSWECPRCPFFDMCKVHERGGDWKRFRDLAFSRRDPYADHRKSAAE